MIGSLLDALPRAIPRSGMARLDRGTTTNTELAALRELAAASGSSVVAPDSAIRAKSGQEPGDTR
jgi:hypothetical protein